MIKAVVVDLDDTLCLTEAVCFDMENDILQRMGREPMARDVHISTWGKPLFEAIAVRSPGVNVDKFRDAYVQVIAEYIESGKFDTIPDENYRALDQLITQDKSIMILTSRTHDELAHMLEPDHLLSARVKTFYYRDNMQYHKPDPRAFNELLQDEKLLPEECVYVGDSPSDAVAAKQAGLHFVASLESGIRQEPDFEGLAVDRYVSVFIDIVEAIASLEEQMNE